MSTLTITSEEKNGVWIMALSGSAAVADLGPLEIETTKMIAHNPEKLVIDVSGLSVLSSLAMGQFMTLAMHVKKNGGAAVIVAPEGNVRGALLRVEIDKRVPLALSIKDGLEVLTQPA